MEILDFLYLYFCGGSRTSFLKPLVGWVIRINSKVSSSRRPFLIIFMKPKTFFSHFHQKHSITFFCFLHSYTWSIVYKVYAFTNNAVLTLENGFKLKIEAIPEKFHTLVISVSYFEIEEGTSQNLWIQHRKCLGDIDIRHILSRSQLSVCINSSQKRWSHLIKLVETSGK